MTKYIIKRSLQSLITIFIVVSVVFICMRLPFMTYMGKGSAPSIKEFIEMLYSFWEQLITKGTFGSARKYVGSTLEQVLFRRSKYSIILSLGITITSYTIGIPLGVLFAKTKRKWLNAFEYIYRTITFAFPEMVIYSAFQIYLVRRLGLPIYYNPKNIFSWITPIMIGSFVVISSIGFFVRRYVQDELNADYVKVAKAKGLSNNTIFYKHILKNISVHLVRNITDTLFIVITASWFLELLYGIPGLAELFHISLNGLRPDMPIGKDVDFVQVTVFAFTTISILGILISDILVRVIDPRIKDY